MTTTTISSTVGGEYQHAERIDPSPLDYQQAAALALQMRADLRPATRDRTWRFKSYSDCFKATHAIAWAQENLNSKESIAVMRLNQLIDYGLLSHVVDPSKKIRVRETRTLYFRIAHVEDLAKKTTTPYVECCSKATPLTAGNFGSSINLGSDDSISIQKRLKDLDYILQQTVKELDDTRGKLEVTHQEVLELVSQQIFIFGVVFFMYVYISVSTLTQTDGVDWLELGFAVTLVIPMIWGWRCVTMWNGIGSRTSPMETIVMSNDDSSIDCSTVENIRSFRRHPAANTLSIFFSKSIRSVSDFQPETIVEPQTKIYCIDAERILPSASRNLEASATFRLCKYTRRPKVGHTIW